MVAGGRAGDPRLRRAIAAIDAANADDPNLLTVDGVGRPKELVHAELMTSWVNRLDPRAGAPQLLAARAHHLRRWTVPRQDHPPGRAGYLRWRSRLREQHAQEVVEILAEVGYDEEVVARVQQIIRKEGLRDDPPDPQVQVHEDALCLVFLQTQLDGMAERLGDDRAVEVVRKSMGKMSPDGRRLAAGLDLSARAAELLGRAAVQP